MRPKPIRAFALVCAATFLFSASTIQAQQDSNKPALSVQAEYVEITVEIDPALDVDPRLRRIIEEEAKQYAAERHADAEEAWRDDRDAFRIGPWFFERNYGLDATAGPYLSVSLLDFWFTGGAHPNSHLDTFLWHREEARRADIFDLFREASDGSPTLTALAGLVREAVIVEKRARGVEVEVDDDWLEAIKPERDGLGAAGLTPSTATGKASGLTFHFSPYAVGSYAEGPYVVDVSWKAFAAHLTEAARKLFAGERPAAESEKP